MQKDYFSKLTSQEKDIIKNKGTEPPFSGEYNDFYKPGIFVCRACKNPLYEAKSKFNSGCGWPSFDDEISGAIVRYEDSSLGRIRTEICCSKCDGHLGHVFLGEEITIKNTRHCVNSLSIQFKPYDNLEEAVFGGGSFWKLDKIFRSLKGVYLSSTGYMGGDVINPTYEQVCNGKTNHTEVVQIYFDPKEIEYKDLLLAFFKNHNPTSVIDQHKYLYTHHRSVVFYKTEEQKKTIFLIKDTIQKEYKKDIITQILPSVNFYRAEEYHQNYIDRNSL